MAAEEMQTGMNYPNLAVHGVLTVGKIIALGETITPSTFKAPNNPHYTNVYIGSEGTGSVPCANGSCVGIGSGVHVHGEPAGDDTVAIGTEAGWSNQGNRAVAIGSHAGECNQKAEAVAIGYHAGRDQGARGVAIGAFADAGVMGVALGSATSANAGGSIAIGSGATVDGEQSIAIGTRATVGAWSNSIALGTAATVTADNQLSIAFGEAPITHRLVTQNVNSRHNSRPDTFMKIRVQGVDYLMPLFLPDE